MKKTDKTSAKKPEANKLEASQHLDGKLLIAMPSMGDVRFERSVIYMCAHSEDGAMGLIVNKPAPELRFNDLLEQLDLKAAREGGRSNPRAFRRACRAWAGLCFALA